MSKLSNSKRRQAPVTAGKGSAPAKVLPFAQKGPDEVQRRIEASGLAILGAQPAPADDSDEAREAAANAPITVPAVLEVSALVSEKWTEEAGIRVFDVAASGHKQAFEALVLFVRDYQTGKLPFVVLNGVFQARRQHDYARTFVASFRQIASDSKRGLIHFVGKLPNDWDKFRQDATKYLSIRIATDSMSLEQVLGERKGGSDSRPFDESKSYNRIAEALSEHCDEIGRKYAKRPHQQLEAFNQMLAHVSGIITFKRAGYCEAVMNAMAADALAKAEASKAQEAK